MAEIICFKCVTFRFRILFIIILYIQDKPSKIRRSQRKNKKMDGDIDGQIERGEHFDFWIVLKVTNYG